MNGRRGATAGSGHGLCDVVDVAGGKNEAGCWVGRGGLGLGGETCEQWEEERQKVVCVRNGNYSAVRFTVRRSEK